MPTSKPPNSNGTRRFIVAMTVIILGMVLLVAGVAVSLKLTEGRGLMTLKERTDAEKMQAQPAGGLTSPGGATPGPLEAPVTTPGAVDR